MNEDHKKIIEDAIRDGFKMKDKYSDYEINSSFQLLLNQLDLLRTISTLVVAVLGVGFFLKEQLNLNFLVVSLIFSVITIVGTISYTREISDYEAKTIKSQGDKLKEKIDTITNKAVESIQKGDPEIFFGFAEKEASAQYLKERLIYAGEIFTFSFYSSIAFLILAFFAEKYQFSLISLGTVLVLTFVWLISFKNWIRNVVDVLSKEIKLF